MEPNLFFNQSLIEAFGWVILHSLWQITIIALVLKLLLKWTANHPATVRYTLGLFALLIAVSWSIHTFNVEWVEQGAATHTTLSTTNSITLTNPIIDSPKVEPSFFSYYEKGMTSLVAVVEPALPYLSFLWLLGLVFFTSRMLVGLNRLHVFSKSGIHVLPKQWEVRLQELKTLSGIQRKVVIRLSELVPVPITYQFFRPIILLPVSIFTGLSDEQIEVLILHELAHIKRHDYLFNLLQSMVEVLFFYHPLIWWISKQVRLEREHCCDDRVMQLRHQPMLYAQTLTQIQGQHYSLKTTLAMSATGNKGVFTQRIVRLFQEQTPYSNLRSISAALMLFFLSGMVMAFYPNASKTPLPTSIETSAVIQDTLPKIKLDITENDAKKSPLILLDDQVQEHPNSLEFNSFLSEQQQREDITSIVVIKEIDLTSKYGSAAKNGVVFIYTKEGPKKGDRFVDTLEKKIDKKAKQLERAKAEEKKLKERADNQLKNELQIAEKLVVEKAREQEKLQKKLEKSQKLQNSLEQQQLKKLEQQKKKALLQKEAAKKQELLTLPSLKDKDPEVFVDGQKYTEWEMDTTGKIRLNIPSKGIRTIQVKGSETISNSGKSEARDVIEIYRHGYMNPQKEASQVQEIAPENDDDGRFILKFREGGNPTFFLDGEIFTDWEINESGNIALNISSDKIHTVTAHNGPETKEKFGKTYPNGVVEFFTHKYLEGQVAPKETRNILIGPNSKNSSSKAPLFVLDGEILPRREFGKAYLEELDPNDIQTINVLKGETALLLYGEAGTDGVVEIITKNHDKKLKKREKKEKRELKRNQIKANKLMVEQQETQSNLTEITKVETPSSNYSELSVFPNPTDQKTNIQVNLAEKGVVKVDIYNIKGQLIENIANRALEKGKHQFEWDSGNHPTGTYFIHFDLDGNLVNKQLMLKK